MSGRIALPLSLIAVMVGLAACGGGDNGTTTFDTDTTFTTTTETTTTTSAETTKLRVYFLLNGKVQPVAREVVKTPLVATAAMAELSAGPTASEGDLGLTSDASLVDHEALGIESGLATYTGTAPDSRTGLAQLVYTLTQFPTVKAVKIGDKSYTRADFEEQTPAILVESPLADEAVSNPIRATGTANTFEANFNYEVIDPTGKVVETNFVTATSGTGTRGTFDFTTKPYTGLGGTGALVVLELSAKDGSRINEVRIPVQLQP